MEYDAAQKYLNQVSRFLICAGEDRKRLLERCRELADSFQQENPDAEYAVFVSAFGEPADCAAELLSTLDASAIESAQKKRRWLHRIEIAVLGVGILALILTAVFWHNKYQYQREFDDEFIWVVGPASEMTEEDFYAAIGQKP